jgi:hypothetical protein
MQSKPIISNQFFMHISRGMIVLIFLLGTSSIYSQSGLTISGNVKDVKTGEDLIGATISIAELPGKGARTNTYGFYSMTLPAGHYVIRVQFIGYATQSKEVTLNAPMKINVNLEEIVSEMSEVVVTSRRKNENVSQTQTGMQKINIRDLKTIPVLFGEKDVLKTIQLLPGIKSVGEGSSGFNVRGGASDQNLILLDEATVYNASHLMGFFSVFNSDAIKDVSVYKGNEPAEYGGRLSSVLDIKMKDGNSKKFVINGGLGLISSHLNIEGPIVKDKGSFIISARRTYVDLFLKLSSDTNIQSTKIHFFDLNTKANYKINENNRIYLSGYYGQDMMGMSSFGLNWGNGTATLRWNHLFTDRLFSNTSLIFSNYDYKININMGDEMNIISRIQDYVIKQDFQLYSSKSNTLKFGFLSTYHKIIPGAITSAGNTDLKSLTNKYSLENAIYFSHQLSFSDKLNVEYGARVSSFSLLGPGSFYTYNSQGNPVDTAKYSSGKFVKTYLHAEPRITLNYVLGEEHSIKAAYARNVQYLHLLSNSTSGSPTDLWIPSSNNVKPEISDQVSLGYYRNFNENLYEFSIEGYYKRMQNQIDYKNGAEINFNENVESQILFGSGRAYGVELYVKKTQGRLNGWISYTLSRTERKFDGINRGHYYPAKQDKTHDISIVAMYEINKKWTLSGNWVFSTGNAVTFPSGKYDIDGKTMMLYTERNASRMPSYHRLDFGATWVRKKTEKFESSWTFSIYNYYGRENAYTITFRNKQSNSEKTEVVLTSLFKFIPSFTYNFRF